MASVQTYHKLWLQHEPSGCPEQQQDVIHPSMASREENVYMAKLWNSWRKSPPPLTPKNSPLKNVTFSLLLTRTSSEQKEEGRGNEDRVTIIRDYRSKIETELSGICEGILRLLDTRLIPSVSSGDSKVFYLKMKGDYHRYLAEIA
ncbi:hypothetical protein ACHQM5_015060 [Ranunculus cassubicifolius]